MVAAVVAALLVAIVVLLGAGLLVETAVETRSPWRWIVFVVLGAVFVWQTFRKLTSDEPVDSDWSWHLKSGLHAFFALLFGGSLALGDTGWQRPLGLLVLLVGIVLAAAARRDFRRWRAAVERERQEPADQARAAAEAPRPRAW